MKLRVLTYFSTTLLYPRRILNLRGYVKAAITELLYATRVNNPGNGEIVWNKHSFPR